MHLIAFLVGTFFSATPFEMENERRFDVRPNCMVGFALKVVLLPPAVVARALMLL
jgi:hypothetical protein